MKILSFYFCSQSVMARLRTFMDDHLQNNNESDTELNIPEKSYYFWSGSKYNHFTENIQSEFCQVIKIDKEFKDENSITILKSLCDISEDYSTSLLAMINETADYFKDDLTDRVFHQSHRLQEAYGLCVRGMTADHALTLSEVFDLSSAPVLTNDNKPIDAEGEDMIYTCQCKPNYGYENCTEVKDIPINGINAGNTYCMTQDQVVLDSTDDSQYIIFMDHVVYGRPKSWSKDPLNIVSLVIVL